MSAEQTEQLLNQAITKVLKYSPYVYTQSASISGIEGDYFIRYPYSELPPNSLLFFLPTTNSIEYRVTPDGTVIKNRLHIKFASINDGVTTYGNDKYYDIVVEQNNGQKTHASSGHIVANRLAILRINKESDSTITLTNSPLYNEISLSSLVVTQRAEFQEIPVVRNKIANEGDPITYTELVTASAFAELAARVNALEDKFQVGTVDAETALAGMPDGTFYVKVDK